MPTGIRSKDFTKNNFTPILYFELNTCAFIVLREGATSHTNM